MCFSQHLCHRKEFQRLAAVFTREVVVESSDERVPSVDTKHTSARVKLGNAGARRGFVIQFQARNKAVGVARTPFESANKSISVVDCLKNWNDKRARRNLVFDGRTRKAHNRCSG